MNDKEIADEIERNRQILLSRGGSLSHRRIAVISQRIDTLRNMRKDDYGRV